MQAAANQPKSCSVLLDAINTTVRTFEDRARLYRNLVVAVSTVYQAGCAFYAKCVGQERRTM